jgi:pyruvate dehydrogenase E1 component alpha subunit
MVDAYRSMLRIRRFEEICLDLHRQGLFRGSIHLGNGQEAVAVGACLALQPQDWVAITYRSHAQCLAKGISAGPLLAEMLGRADGVCRGKGGSMHLGDMSKGVIPANAIVGSGLPIATGVALSLQLDKAPQVVVAFHGDGALNQGSWHEAMNLAAVWALPVIFLCENNLYSEMTPISHMVRIARLADRAGGYGIPAQQVDGNDVRAVYGAVSAAVDRARSGGGPTFLEALTYRLGGHYQADAETYRSRDEVEAWRQRDPLTLVRAALLVEGLNQDQITALEKAVEAELKAATDWALGRPVADAADAFTDAYVTQPAYPAARASA